MRIIDESNRELSADVTQEKSNLEKQERERRIGIYAQQIDHAQIAKEDERVRRQREPGR